jgi:hypothetical protein
VRDHISWGRGLILQEEPYPMIDTAFGGREKNNEEMQIYSHAYMISYIAANVVNAGLPVCLL